jgi:hypothetical protein
MAFTRLLVLPAVALSLLVGPLAFPASAIPAAGPATAHLRYVPTGFSSGYLSATKFTWSPVAGATSYDIVSHNFGGAVDQQSGFTLYQTLGPDTGVGVLAHLSGDATTTTTPFTLPFGQGWVPMARLEYKVNTTTLTNASTTFTTSLLGPMLATFDRYNCDGGGVIARFTVTASTDDEGAPSHLLALAEARAASAAQMIIDAVPSAHVTTRIATALLPAPTTDAALRLNRSVTIRFKLFPLPDQAPAFRHAVC